MTASSGANGRGSPSLPNPTVPHQGEEVLPKPAVTPTIAVIDRSSEARDEIGALLEHVGYEVQTYASVEEYKSARRSGDAGCIILDVWSPGHSGLGLAAAVAAFRAGVPIIFVGAHADVHIAVQAMKAGATDFLTKPVRHLELLEAVKQATADHDRAANPA
jgi:FixJ family two-component response regulator